MNTLAIFLILAFLTGCQAAVLGDEPAKSILEQIQDPFGKFSTIVTENINAGLGKFKDGISDGFQWTWNLLSKQSTWLQSNNAQRLNRKLQQYTKDAKQKMQEGINQLQTHGALQFKKMLTWADQEFHAVLSEIKPMTDAVKSKVQELPTQVKTTAGDLNDRLQEVTRSLVQVGQNTLSWLTENSPPSIQPHVKDLQKKLAI